MIVVRLAELLLLLLWCETPGLRGHFRAVL